MSPRKRRKVSWQTSSPGNGREGRDGGGDGERVGDLSVRGGEGVPLLGEAHGERFMGVISSTGGLEKQYYILVQLKRDPMIVGCILPIYVYILLYFMRREAKK